MDTKITIPLKDIGDVAVGQTVTVVVKIVKVSLAQTTKMKDGREIKKQDCYVGDVAGCVRVVIGALVQDLSYKLVGVSVCDYGCVRYLSVGTECEIVSVDDIGEVVEDDTRDEEFACVNYVFEGDVDGVYYCDEYFSCMSFKLKVQSADGIVGECGKCGMTVKMNKGLKCVTAHVVVCGNDGKNHNLMLFKLFGA